MWGREAWDLILFIIFFTGTPPDRNDLFLCKFYPSSKNIEATKSMRDWGRQDLRHINVINKHRLFPLLQISGLLLLQQQSLLLTISTNIKAFLIYILLASLLCTNNVFSQAWSLTSWLTPPSGTEYWIIVVCCQRQPFQTKSHPNSCFFFKKKIHYLSVKCISLTMPRRDHFDLVGGDL